MAETEPISTEELAEKVAEHGEGLKNQQDHIKNLEGQLKEKDVVIADLTTQRDSFKFDKAGYPIEETGPGKLLAATFPEDRELTVEAIREFAVENGLEGTAAETLTAVSNPEGEGRLAEMQASSVSLIPKTDDEEQQQKLDEATKAGDMKAVIHLQTARFDAP